VAASLLAHTFLTPGPALLGLIAMLPALELSSEAKTIEVELISIPIAPVGDEPGKEVEKENLDSRSDESKEPPAKEEIHPSPLVPPETLKKKAAPVAPLPEEKKEAPVSPSKSFGDPVALAGSAGQIADSNANVRLFIYTDVARSHPLGKKVGELLRRTPQWRDFFGPSNIDPVADIDRVMIAGPQFRNSSQIVAVVQHHLSRARIRGALTQLVERKGEWIDEEGLIARADADRATRIFAAPNKRIVIVTPPQLEKQVRALGSAMHFPESTGDVVVTAYFVTPWRATRNIGLNIPKTIEWARFDLRPTPEGGAILKVLAQDENVASAKKHAQVFGVLIEQLTSLDLGMLGLMMGTAKKSYIKSVVFKNKGKQIVGTVEVTKEQLLLGADLLSAFLPPVRKIKAQDKAAESAKTIRSTDRKTLNLNPLAGPLGNSAQSQKTRPIEIPPGRGSGGSPPAGVVEPER